MSLTNEYVHFLQAVSSLHGFKFLADLIDFGVHGALVLEGLTPGDGGNFSGYKEIIPMLKKHPDHAGQANPKIKERTTLTLDEARALLTPLECQYAGTKAPWDVAHQDIVWGTYRESFWGFVTPRGCFRPFTPGLLSEGMARQIDQWVKRNQGYHAHSWPASSTETEYYRGIWNVLSQPCYTANVTPGTLERVTVIVCYLALATKRPDESTVVMLKRLSSQANTGILPQAVALDLKDVLVSERMLHAKFFNEVMDEVLGGTGRIMARSEWLGIHEQLKNISAGGNRVLSDPAGFADEAVNWTNIRTWMTRHSLPPIVAADGLVQAVDGVPCTTTVTDFLSEVQRVLF
ncbi:MAG: hypothetical protein NTV38_11780 [Chloroflexi bacterium]|nr:hypothetical protein [Chloroflexota bacterium]